MKKYHNENKDTEVLPEDNDIFKECEENKDDAGAHPDVQG